MNIMPTKKGNLPPQQSSKHFSTNTTHMQNVIPLAISFFSILLYRPSRQVKTSFSPNFSYGTTSVGTDLFLRPVDAPLVAPISSLSCALIPLFPIRAHHLGGIHATKGATTQSYDCGSVNGNTVAGSLLLSAVCNLPSTSPLSRAHRFRGGF